MSERVQASEQRLLEQTDAVEEAQRRAEERVRELERQLSERVLAEARLDGGEEPNVGHAAGLEKGSSKSAPSDSVEQKLKFNTLRSSCPICYKATRPKKKPRYNKLSYLSIVH